MTNDNPPIPGVNAPAAKVVNGDLIKQCELMLAMARNGEIVSGAFIGVNAHGNINCATVGQHDTQMHTGAGIVQHIIISKLLTPQKQSKILRPN